MPHPAQDGAMQPQFVSDIVSQGRFAPAVDPAVAEPADQPLSQRAALAVALAPVLVLLALTLVIGDLIEPYLGLAGVLLSVVWLVLEMHQYQRTMTRQESDAGDC